VAFFVPRVFVIVNSDVAHKKRDCEKCAVDLRELETLIFATLFSAIALSAIRGATSEKMGINPSWSTRIRLRIFSD